MTPFLPPPVSLAHQQQQQQQQQPQPQPPPQPSSGPPVDLVPGTPWWLPNATDPSGLPQFQQVANPDFNLEMLGLNLNELWGNDTWDWDGV